MSLGNFKNILLHNEAFVHVRYSAFFLKLWLLLRPGVRAKLKAQDRYYFEFIKNLKSGEHVAFDIGANEGFVSETFLENKMSVVAVEPDPRNIAILKRRFLNNDKFHLSTCAAGSRSGKKELYLQKNGTAFSTLNPKWKNLVETGGYRFHFLYEPGPDNVQLITIDQLMDIYGMPSVIKIDVEGYEKEVMKGLSRKVPLIIFEANLPEFADETFDCLAQLHEMDQNILFNYSSSFQLNSDYFLGYEDFKRGLLSIGERCIDIVCIMSNYFDYYTQLPVSK